jgi:hypothetical protein
MGPHPTRRQPLLQVIAPELGGGIRRSKPGRKSGRKPSFALCRNLCSRASYVPLRHGYCLGLGHCSDIWCSTLSISKLSHYPSKRHGFTVTQGGDSHRRIKRYGPVLLRLVVLWPDTPIRRHVFGDGMEDSTAVPSPASRGELMNLCRHRTRNRPLSLEAKLQPCRRRPQQGAA